MNLHDKANNLLYIGQEMKKAQHEFAIKTLEHSIKCAQALGKTGKVDELRKELAERKARK